MIGKTYLFIITTIVIVFGIIFITVGAIIYQKSVNGDYNSKIKNPAYNKLSIASIRKNIRIQNQDISELNLN